MLKTALFNVAALSEVADVKNSIIGVLYLISVYLFNFRNIVIASTRHIYFITQDVCFVSEHF